MYERFLVVNGDVKPLISQWQLTRDAAGPDEATAVLDRLDELHREVVPVVAAASELVAAARRVRGSPRRRPAPGARR